MVGYFDPLYRVYRVLDIVCARTFVPECYLGNTAAAVAAAIVHTVSGYGMASLCVAVAVCVSVAVCVGFAVAVIVMY